MSRGTQRGFSGVSWSLRSDLFLEISVGFSRVLGVYERELRQLQRRFTEFKTFLGDSGAL